MPVFESQREKSTKKNQEKIKKYQKKHFCNQGIKKNRVRILYPLELHTSSLKLIFQCLGASQAQQNDVALQKKCTNKVDIAFLFEIPNRKAATTFNYLRQIVDLLAKVRTSSYVYTIFISL